MASPGRILHFSENLTLPFDRRVWMELNALSGAGYEVSAICPMGEGGREPYEALDGIHVWRYPPPPETSGFASSVWELLYCWLQALPPPFFLLMLGAFDVIHTSNPPCTLWALALQSRPFGLR